MKPRLGRGVGRLLRSQRCAPLVAVLVALALIALDALGALQSPRTTLITSLDTNAAHFRNDVVRRFADVLAERSDGRLRLALFESGQLMSDRDVVKALAFGMIDFALPPDSKIARFEADANLMSLPLLYGLPEAEALALADGPIGARMRSAVAASMDVVVLAPALDLGFTATYTTEHDLAGPADYAGLKIRIPGGAGPAALFEALGAVPLAMPFADVPLALSQGNLDGLQSTHETIRTTRLWDAGLRYCLEDRANLIQYLPMVSNRAWSALPEDLQTLFETAWREVATASKKTAHRMQADARAVLQAHGIECVASPGPEAPVVKARLAEAAHRMALRTGMTPSLMEDLSRSFEPGKGP